MVRALLMQRQGKDLEVAKALDLRKIWCTSSSLSVQELIRGMKLKLSTSGESRLLVV